MAVLPDVVPLMEISPLSGLGKDEQSPRYININDIIIPWTNFKGVRLKGTIDLDFNASLKIM